MGRRFGGAWLSAVLVATGLVTVGSVPTGLAAEGEPPANLGFEDGVLGGDPIGWEVVSRADEALVVDRETGEDSPSYASVDKVVEPHNGDLMLRLGAPKEIAETQTTGPTTVRQTFTVPDGEPVAVAARILSWEFRDIDRVGFRADGAYLTEPVTFFGGSSAARTCDASTTTKDRGKDVYPASWDCDVSIAGTKGSLLDSDWQLLHLAPRPDVDADPDTITLAYTVEGTVNASHATWAYLDDVNRPPVAQFASEPPAGALVPEGSLVRLRDESFDPDRPDDVVAWSWTVTAPDGVLLDDDEVLTSTATDPSFFPPDDGTYTVDLTVTSSDGTTGHTGATISVANAPALVNTLDVDVLPGERAPILARYLDSGWTDTHTATTDGDPVTVPPPTVAAPVLRRGVVTGSVPAPGDAGASRDVPVAVRDTDLGTAELPAGSIDEATVTVIPDAPTRAEDVDDAVTTAPRVVADVSRLSWIQETGDVDIVELGLAGGDLLPGTEVVAALDEVPADLDLVVLAQAAGSTETAPYQMAPYQMAPYQMAPYQMAPYQMAPITQAPYQMAPYQMAPYQMAELGLSPYQMAPYQMAPYQMAPLSSDPTIASTVTGGGDIDPAELGIEALLASAPGLQVAGFSANRGLATEQVLVRVDQPGTRLYVVVLGANGTYSDSPYRLRLESSAPWNAVADADASIRTELEGAFCSGTPVADRGVTPPAVTLSGAPSTLIVTQLDRLQAAHPGDDWDGFMAALAAYAEDPLVRGRIVDLPPGIYDDWDRTPCRVAEANEVTDAIRTAVHAELASGSFDYVVIVGDDSIVPFRRTTTGVVIGDESQYLAGSFLQPGSPLAAALAASQELTDDFYTDLDPVPFQSGELYVPDVVGARMVETPDEIAGAMDAFRTARGYLAADTAAVTAHDFLADGGDAIADSLAGAVGEDGLTRLVDAPETPATDQWSTDDLRCAWLGSGDACGDGADLVSPNSHWTHYASLSARGFATDLAGLAPGLSDILTSAEVATTPAATPQLVFTIGCHAGFSVPDDQSLDGTAYGIDPALDFPQALARRQAVYVASTGFGLGDTEGLAGTERLMADFAEELLVDGVTAGQALLAAKRGYAHALSTVSTYDVKSLVQQTLYGPPQYRVFEPAPAQTLATTLAPVPAGTVLDDAGNGTTTTTFAFTPEPDGSAPRYWTVGDDVQITPGRPWQPRAVLTDGVDAATRGALILGGSYDEVTGVDPVVTRPAVEWEQGPATLDDTCRNSWWPADLTTITDGALVVVPGQFRCTTGTTGTQRLFDELLYELTGDGSFDRTPPSAGPLDIRSVDGQLELRFPASDASGISRIVPLVLHDGTISSEEVVDPVADAGTFRVLMTAPTGADIVVQVVDGAGNVTTLTGRGANLRYLDVRAASPVLYDAAGATTFSATVPDITPEQGAVQYLWQFGDGTTASGTVDPALDTDPDTPGITFAVPHTYTDRWREYAATVRVWDADGATGTADVRVARRCDPTGDVTAGLEWGDIESCGVAVADGIVTFMLGYAAPVSAGGTYRIEVDAKPGAKKSQLTQMKYTPPTTATGTGSWNGPSSLTVTREGAGRVLVFTVAARDLGVSTTSPSFAWRSDVQSGVPGSAGDGIIDRLPDGGWLSYPTG